MIKHLSLVGPEVLTLLVMLAAWILLHSMLVSRSQSLATRD